LYQWASICVLVASSTQRTHLDFTIRDSVTVFGKGN